MTRTLCTFLDLPTPSSFSCIISPHASISIFGPTETGVFAVLFHEQTTLLLALAISRMTLGNGSSEHPSFYLSIHVRLSPVDLFLSKMSLISAFEPPHLEDGATEEGKRQSLNLFSRCLPFAGPLGFWDEGCPQHHDCCLPGLQRKGGEGWRAGERSLQGGSRGPLSSGGKKQQMRWPPAAYLRAFTDTPGPCPGVFSVQVSLDPNTEV